MVFKENFSLAHLVNLKILSSVFADKDHAQFAEFGWLCKKYSKNLWNILKGKMADYMNLFIKSIQVSRASVHTEVYTEVFVMVSCRLIMVLSKILL